MPPNPIDEVKLAERLTRLEEGQKALATRVDEGFNSLRSDLALYLETQKENEKAVHTLERQQAQHATALASCATSIGDLRQEHKDDVSSLRGRINNWSGVNSLGTIIAGIIAFFK